MSHRLSNAVQAALVATIVAVVFTSIFLDGGSSNSIVPSRADAVLATLLVTGPIWYLAFPTPTGDLERAKKVGAIVVFVATIAMFAFHFFGNLEPGSFATAEPIQILAIPFTIVLFAALTCFFFGIILLPTGAYAAFYLRRYQINHPTKLVN